MASPGEDGSVATAAQVPAGILGHDSGGCCNYSALQQQQQQRRGVGGGGGGCGRRRRTAGPPGPLALADFRGGHGLPPGGGGGSGRFGLSAGGVLPHAQHDGLDASDGPSPVSAGPSRSPAPTDSHTVATVQRLTDHQLPRLARHCCHSNLAIPSG